MASFYADEQFPVQVTELLRNLGHDVLTVQEAGNANQQTCRETKVAYRANFTFISALQSIDKYQSYKFKKMNHNQGLISVIIIPIRP
jgi:hypothetical protein